ncbi:hypothetical protein RUM43_008120 [Polyplax serrata]|uniref:Uncharacterized protein n=1 Tax=Polyplax serrata TaxID=468196 RepID=A0AAN8PA36_POLSC
MHLLPLTLILGHDACRIGFSRGDFDFTPPCPGKEEEEKMISAHGGVPLKGFIIIGKILEKYDSVLPNKSGKLPLSSQQQQQQGFYNPLSQPPTPPHTPLSPYLKYQKRREGSADGDGPEDPEVDTFEQFKVRMAADLAKMAGLPSSSVLNSSRVMFPQNLTSMLSLAAIQDHGKSDSQDGNESPPLSGPTILVEPKHERYTSAK